MKLLLGQKVGMTQLWNEKGKLVPVTVIKALRNKITKDGEKTVVVAERTGKANKAQQYLAKSLDSKGIWVKQLTEPTEENELNVAHFSIGEILSISGTTKGKGFSGTIKRHNFHRGPVSHGSDNVRSPGSIGAQRPQRVPLGKKMAGQMGNEQLTVRGNKVVAVDSEQQLLMVSGAVPGTKRGYVEVRA